MTVFLSVRTPTHVASLDGSAADGQVIVVTFLSDVSSDVVNVGVMTSLLLFLRTNRGAAVPGRAPDDAFRPYSFTSAAHAA